MKRKCFVFLAACNFLCGAARAKDAGAPADLDALVQRAFAPKVEAGEIAGAAIAVVRGEETRFFYLGKTSLENGAAPDAETLYEIGSITKVITGDLLALMISDGAVSLDTPVQELLPAEVTVPARDGKPITLLGLTTHSSGLPRMPANFRPADNNAPYVDYDVAKLYDCINTCKPARAQGAQYEYSNLATALLGHALARKAGKPYEDLVRERIFTPLGMTATHIASSEAQLAQLAKGHTARRRYLVLGSSTLAEQGRWDFDVFQPAGGVRSNIADMARFLRANMAPDATPLGAALKAAQAPIFTVNGDMSLGMNWHILTRPEKGGPITFHNGQTGGYHSFLGFDATRQAGVVVLCNTTADIDPAALEILNGLDTVPW